MNTFAYLLVGVYFEKILKKSNSNLWLRNIQLGMHPSGGWHVCSIFRGCILSNYDVILLCMYYESFIVRAVVLSYCLICTNI